MPLDPTIYHITEISNLPSIIHNGLVSDALLANVPHAVIGYSNIKERRMTEYRVPCCGNRFVGEFVPFYYCPRSPMLYTINNGNTGKPAGHQKEIVHLVTTVSRVAHLGRAWAISDGNAGAAAVSFASDMNALERMLDWDAIKALDWRGRTRQKMAEFLVADAVPWTSIFGIGVIDQTAAQRVHEVLNGVAHQPEVKVLRNWYY